MKAKCFILLFVTTLSLQLFAGDMEYYFWKGKINGSDVKLACAVKDGVMTGEMFEDNVEYEAIYNVAGYETDGMYDIRIYNDNDGVNFMYFMRCEIKGGDLIGITQPNGNKVKMKKFKDKYARPINREPGMYSSPYIEGKNFRMEGWDRGGRYLYENPMHVKGELTLWGNMNDDSYTLSIRRDSGPYNGGNDALVDASGLFLPDNGNFEYTIPYCGYTFSVKFYDHFLVIRSLFGPPSGCFGSGAAITGIYILEPAKG